MEPSIGLPKFLPRWLCFVVFWILLSVVFATAGSGTAGQ